MTSTHVIDIDGREIFVGDMVEMYTAATLSLKNNEGLMEKSAGIYKVVCRNNEFILKEIEPNWFLPYHGKPIGQFNILKVIESKDDV